MIDTTEQQIKWLNFDKLSFIVVFVKVWPDF